MEELLLKSLLRERFLRASDYSAWYFALHLNCIKQELPVDFSEAVVGGLMNNIAGSGQYSLGIFFFLLNIFISRKISSLCFAHFPLHHLLPFIRPRDGHQAIPGLLPLYCQGQGTARQADNNRLFDNSTCNFPSLLFCSELPVLPPKVLKACWKDVA